MSGNNENISGNGISKKTITIIALGVVAIMLCFLVRQVPPASQSVEKPVIANDLSRINHATATVPRRPPTDTVVAPSIVLPASNEPLLRNLPVKQYKHISAKYFALSLGKDTPEGQIIASKLIENGCGIEYTSDVYQTAKTLARVKDDIKSGAANKEVYDLIKMKVLEEFSVGVNGLPPFPKPSILDELLELTPSKAYFPTGVETITKAEGPESEWLTEGDVLKYIKEHPAKNPASS